MPIPPSREKLLIILKQQQFSSRGEGKGIPRVLILEHKQTSLEKGKRGLYIYYPGVFLAKRASISLWRAAVSGVSRGICYLNVPFAQKGQTLQEHEKTSRNCHAAVHHQGSDVKLMKLITGMMFLLNLTYIYRRIQHIAFLQLIYISASLFDYKLFEI